MTSEYRTTGNSETIYSRSYTYDARGNRTSMTADGETVYYDYDLANRLVGKESSDGYAAYFYDNNGNMVEYQPETLVPLQVSEEPVTRSLTAEADMGFPEGYTYNAANQFVNTFETNIEDEYTYYPDGKRKTRTTGAVETVYVWDGDRLVLEIVGGTAYKYIWGLNLVAQVNGNTKRYYQYDAHGNVVWLRTTQNSGKSYDYDAFGNELNPNPSDTNPFRYCGEYYDTSTGLYNLQARHYSPELGRFTQEDTYHGAPDNPLSWNFYTYCYNDPVQYVDPSGNIAESPLDWVSLGVSVVEFIITPSWTSAGNVLWDVVAVVAPGLPGSYVVDVAKGMDKLGDAQDAVGAIAKAEKVADGTATVKLGKYAGAGQYVGTGAYGTVKGHHVFSKAAFRGNVNYNPRKGFSLSQEFMEKYDLDHNAITKKQRELFAELCQSGRENTVEEQARIAREALSAGRKPGSTLSDDMIDDLVRDALADLWDQAATRPTRIPWHSRIK